MKLLQKERNAKTKAAMLKAEKGFKNLMRLKKKIEADFKKVLEKESKKEL